jgi:hypothetical protein
MGSKNLMGFKNLVLFKDLGGFLRVA